MKIVRCHPPTRAALPLIYHNSIILFVILDLGFIIDLRKFCVVPNIILTALVNKPQ